MQNSSQPKLIPTPFADNGARQNIPNDSQIGITAGRASYTDGFPPLTRTPLAAGGVPPFGTDFNGVLNDITAAVRWSQSGAGYSFNTAFNTAIGGYPKGARIPNSTLDGYWLNTIDGNTANPEVTGAATTGWVPAESYGLTAITGLSGSSVTLTTLQASKERITLSGALSSNINVVVPAWVKRWTIVNNCTGAFTVTIKTPSGSGVPISGGTVTSLQGDGVNIIPGYLMGALINVQTFTASGTYTPTLGTRSLIVEVVGGGGGGGNASAANSSSVALGRGAGGGGYAKSYLTTVPSSQTVTVGLGGASYTNGGDSSFGNIVARGGTRGAQDLNATWTSGVQQQIGSPGGQATNGNIINAAGSYGIQPIWTTFGNCISGAGGGSFFSGTTTPVMNTAPGTNGAIGCGGSGACSYGNTSVLAGGSGGNGIVIIWEYA